MRVCGIDYSSRFVDIVTIRYDGPGAPVWHRFPLVGSDAFDRARSVADALPGRSSVMWDDVLAVGIESPGARHPGVNVLWRIQGAILAQFPARMLVKPLSPSEWRKAVGLPGNASKSDVEVFACRHVSLGPAHFSSPQRLFASGETPQDMFDAYCIAVATRQQITTEQAA